MGVSPTLLKIGLPTLGLGGTGVAAWQLAEHLSYSSPINSDMDVGDLKKDSTFGNYDCFDKFFSGKLLSGVDYETSEETVDDSKFKVVVPTDTGDSSKTIGCSLMRLVYGKNLKDDKQIRNFHDLPVFTFKAEITVKNDRVGWALWVIGEGREHQTSDGWPNYKQELKYRLMFLENKNNGWEIKGGYEWYDSFGFSRIFTMNVDVPTGTWIKEQEDRSAFFNSKNAKYAGVWEAGAGKRKIFDEIHVSAYKRDDAEILGRSSPEFKSFDDSKGRSGSAGYSQLFTKYKDRKWVTYAPKSENDNKKNNGADISSVLNEWYKPFKDVEGGWRSISDYCWNVSKNRDKQAFREICKTK